MIYCTTATFIYSLTLIFIFIFIFYTHRALFLHCVYDLSYSVTEIIFQFFIESVRKIDSEDS